MPAICTFCKHPAHRADCGVDDCGCVRYEMLTRKPRQRTWLVRVRFFELNRWTSDVELRVRASTSGGAALKAVREAKRQRTSRRRVMQTRIMVAPVPRSGT
jgi:hypothetical protein